MSFVSLKISSSYGYLHQKGVGNGRFLSSNRAFPRKNIHRPEGANNEANVWAYKVEIEDTKPEMSKSRPLAGRTITFKDCVEVGKVPQIGVLEAGAKIVGLATCENQCTSTSSSTSSTGNVPNPYGKSHSAGVGSGEVDLAVGADQGGSIRVPSCQYGIIGLKPTFGLIPYSGIGSNEVNNDHAGPMIKDVLDNALLLSVVAGVDGFDDRQMGEPLYRDVPNYMNMLKESSIKGMKIGILKVSLEVSAMTEAMKQKLLQQAKLWEALGAEVVEVSIPYHHIAPEIWMTGQRVAGAVRKLGMQCGRRVVQSVKPLITVTPGSKNLSTKHQLTSKTVLSTHPGIYLKTINISFKARAEYDNALSTVDLLIKPTVPFAAPRNGDRNANPITRIKNTIGLNANTGIFNITGHPALTFPMEFSASQEDPDMKFPVGIQIIVYAFAYEWEKAYNWKVY
ncbi:Glutamyl-tRNA(Gln) amidotransferase subunit A (amidase) [Scheffersomyces stipitis CBS 6054]|uniref:Glutamyl-tRNA(Gln) amidotransferase subunit A (Amidase) n=1 Tax=Scheffersomyces stipitis (strain ATCC 58785 / CBS 6054 / NBRC 10063 / NRRL Y-11545) TaxID=322104 RepID=A3GHE0_PICST|nr:Glutamyl-tRNA(Gln) amidotransferase subunit A (amidase) [Scheffersomyces stipitis CBS 6054]EAZ62802.2 Glutamyl-tRNA(Gln) amidotransferase subunit A (amidase) [Scheffersomyces stipitis CBS 6054]